MLNPFNKPEIPFVIRLFLLSIGLVCLGGLGAVAQTTTTTQPAPTTTLSPSEVSINLESTIYVLIGTIAILLLLALALGLSTAALLMREKSAIPKPNTTTLVILGVLGLSPGGLAAAETGTLVSGKILIAVLVGFLGVMVIINLMLFWVFMIVLRKYLKAEYHHDVIAELSPAKRFSLAWFSGVKPASTTKEWDVDLQHEYDGITELDNPAPPLFNYILWGTVTFAVVYLVFHHVLGILDSQKAEYDAAYAYHSEQKREKQKQLANMVNETNVKLLTAADDLQSGQKVYTQNCASCHGEAGEGRVGPNLTDKYWLHGGSVQDVFKTIKLGVPTKGMKSWQEDLTPAQIAQVASYILTLKPAKGKEPEGKLDESNTTDSTDTAQKQNNHPKPTVSARKAKY